MAARKPLVVVSGTLQELPATDILLFNIPQVIEVTDNTSAALRITQLGTGPALLVEDSSNPDSTPFVIDASGNVVVGSTAADVTSAGNTPAYQVLGAGDNNASMFLVRYSANTGSGTMRMGKSRSTTVGGRGAVQSGDNLGILSMYGDDGTNFILGAQIIAAVDGTPGTNDMPGRLVFFTTADGASSPTERMRINSSGNMGIGGAPSAGRSLEILKQLTGSSFSYQVNANYQIASDVLTETATFQSFVATQAAAFTLANLRHFKAVQSTIGAGSSITNQCGFFADSTLIGATNNYGFYSNIASGANRYNFYAAGTADNYFAGNVGVGITVPNYPLHVRKDSTGADTWVTSQNATATGANGAGFMAYQGTDSNYSYFRQGADGNTYIVNAGTGAIQFYTGITEVFRIGAAGQFGIGGANYGTSGQVLTSGGSGAAPSWTTISGGSSQWANTAEGIEYTGGKVGIEDQLELEIPASIVAANTNTINLYAKRMCYNGNYAKMMVATQDTSGIEDVLQSSIWRKKIALWDAPGNTTTVPGVMGLVPPTAVGTTTSRNVTTTNVQTRARRLGYVSAATAGSLSGHYINQAQVTIGGGDGFGGFFYSCRFGISASAATARAFIGLSSNTSAPTNVSPATLTNCLGVGFDSGNSNLSVYWGGSTAHTPLPCTSDFPVSTSALYEFTIYNPSNSSLYVYWRLERLGTSFVVDGVFGVTPGTDIPANTTMLAHRAWICNGSTASAVAIDIASIYMETLY